MWNSFLVIWNPGEFLSQNSKPGQALRDAPQTAPIPFHGKEIIPAGLLQFYLPPWATLWSGAHVWMWKQRCFPSSFWFLKNQHSTVLQPLWSHSGIKQERWDGADTCAVGSITEEAGTAGHECKLQLGKLWLWKTNRRGGIRRLPAEMEGVGEISAEKHNLQLKELGQGAMV